MKQKNYGFVFQWLFVSLSLTGIGQSFAAQTPMEKIDVILEGAKKNLDKQNILNKEIQREIRTARNYLKGTKHDEVALARQKALSAGAQVFFSTDFQKAEDQLKKETLKNSDSLKNLYSDLELRAIRHQNLGQAGLTILQAVKDGAKTYAPEKLNDVLKKYKEVSVYINDHRYDVDEIKSGVQMVNEGANQLLQTTHEIAEVKKNAGNSMASVEDVVATKQSAVVTPNIEVEKVKRIQKQFSASEAEIYQDGDTLVMRLRGLKFPVAKALLSNSDLRLLGKVQRVIKDLKSNEVIVEGHTDNLGSKEQNEKISKIRAETIKDYLLSIDAIPANKIKTVGKAEETPIATNQSPEGRAQNRRVDLLIKL